MGLILSRRELKREIKKLKKENKRIVFTNGCFDIIHVGHIKYLEKAKKLGDILIVGLNTDRSVSKIKPLRPINSEKDRAQVIASLWMVDYVTLFDETTPFRLIKSIQPQVLVKGGDWKVENIIGAELVEEVHSLPYVEGHSTTDIIEKILNKYGQTNKLNTKIIKKAKKIKLLILDVDGVLTTGEIIFDNESNELKIFNVRDGHGLVMLNKSGIKIAIITGRNSRALERRMKELGITEVFQDVREKLTIFNKLIEKYNLKKEEIAAMGDDIIDLSILSRVGLSFAPLDAHDFVKKRVDYITEKRAGYGAVREVCDLILTSKNLLDSFINEYKNL